jgi:hypothetical protein
MKTLSISDVRKFDSTKSVWVINTTSSSPAMRRNKNPETGKWKQERADVVLMISSVTIHGERETVVVPQSFLPVDLTEYTSIRDLLECRSFLRAVREGLLTIIDDESAEELFNAEGAAEERARLQEKQQRLREIGAAKGITNTEVVNVSNPTENEYKKAEVRAVQELPEVEEDQYDATFVANVLLWAQMDDLSALNGMKAAGRFSRKELKYILSKLNPKIHPTTINHIKTVLKNASKAKEN